MVRIAKKEFNMEMDNYIKRRRMNTDDTSIKEKLTNIKNDINEWQVFSMFKRKKREKDPYIEDYDDEDDEDYTEEETEIEAIDEIEDELDERRESALKRFFKKLRFKGRRKREIEDEDDEYLEPEEDEYDIDEIKEVIKITHKWLEELPPEQIERFKRSEDFQKYKAILKKLEMIK